MVKFEKFYVHVVVLVVVLLAGIALRVAFFWQLPAGLNQDEAAAAYEGYSLLLTGKDRWGNVWPSYFLAWGSGQNILYSLLSIPFIKLLGLNIFSTRIISVLAGIFALFILYKTLHLTRNKKTATIAVLLLAMSPWHIMASRWGLESNLLPVVFLTAVYFLQKSLVLKTPGSLVISGLLFALTLYAYGTIVMVLPFFLVLVLIWHRKQLLEQSKSLIFSAVIFTAVAMPFTFFFIKNYITHKAYEFESILPFSIPVLLIDRYSQITSSTGAILLSNLQFIISGLKEGWIPNGYPDIWPLSLFLPFVIPGIIINVKKVLEKKQPSVFFTWFLASLSLLLFVPLNLNRANTFLIPLVVLAAEGIIFTAGLFHKKYRMSFTVIVLIASIAYSTFFTFAYFSSYNAKSADAFNAGLDHALYTVKDHEKGENVYISDRISLNYIYILFYDQTHPEDFRANSEILYENGNIQVTHYRNYYFSRNSINTFNENYIYLIKGNEPVPCENPEVFQNTGLWKSGRCVF